MDRRIVRIRSLKGGHHRIGRYFGAEPTDIEARALSRKELAALWDDPDLDVLIIHDNGDAQTNNPAA